MSVKPFSEQGHYTVVHDTIFDRIMPKCPPSAWKVLCLVLRKTRGWKKDWDSISYGQIREGTGIKSDATVRQALDWLTGKNLLLCNEGEKWEASTYSLNKDFELPGDSTTENEVEDASPTTETEVSPTTETVDTRTIQQEPSSRRDADASPDVEEDTFGFFCKLADALEIPITPEDRTRGMAKHLKDLKRMHDPTREELKKVISKVLEARANGYEMSPQKALGKVRGGNVVKFPSSRPDESMVSTAGYKRFDNA